jgi:hypothetical protein
LAETEFLTTTIAYALTEPLASEIVLTHKPLPEGKVEIGELKSLGVVS